MPRHPRIAIRVPQREGFNLLVFNRIGVLWISANTMAQRARFGLAIMPVHQLMNAPALELLKEVVLFLILSVVRMEGMNRRAGLTPIREPGLLRGLLS